VGQASQQASREPLRDAVITERAFLRHILFGVDEAAAIRASLNAVAAAEAVFSSISTTPSGVVNVAPTGQTCVHGESAQWLHILGTKNSLKDPPVRPSVRGLKPSMPPLGESTIGSSMCSSSTW